MIRISFTNFVYEYKKFEPKLKIWPISGISVRFGLTIRSCTQPMQRRSSNAHLGNYKHVHMSIYMYVCICTRYMYVYVYIDIYIYKKA